MAPVSSAARRGALAITAAVCAFAALVRTDALPWLRGPAPYPPEWQWALARKALDVRVLPAIATVAALALLVWWTGTLSATRRERAAAPLVLAAAWALGVVLQVALLRLEPGGAVRTLVERTVSGSYTSYHRVASSAAAEDPGRFLAEHAALLPALRRGTPHAATHPPGPVLYYRALIALAARAPGPAGALERAARARGVDPAALMPPQSREGLAAALLGALLLGALGAAACWPVAALARAAGAEPLAAVRAGVLWVLVPGGALMLPELDTALALFVAGLAACAAWSLLAASPRRAIALALAAGVLAGGALFLSFGAAPLAAIAIAAAVALARPSSARLGRASLAFAAGGLAITALPMAWGYRPWLSAARALAIHREQFTAPRSYPLWLAFGPLEMCVFLGVPVSLLLAARLARRAPTAVGRFRAAAVLGTAALFLTGAVRGEVGRILVPLMPLLLVAAAPDEETPALGGLIALGLGACCLVLRLSWQVP